MEIEKKYTLKYLPEPLSDYRKIEIEQGYLLREPTVRVRKANDRYILTIKEIPQDVSEEAQEEACIRREEEFFLSEEAYRTLLAKCDGVILSKTRYLIPLSGENAGLTVELDVFHGYLSGLFFAEVEFPDEERARSFRAPDWFDQDVSADYHYRNGYLSSLEPGEPLWYDNGKSL